MGAERMMRGLVLRKYDGTRARLADVMGSMFHLENEDGGGAWMHENMVYDFYKPDDDQSWAKRCPTCHQVIEG